MTEHDWAPICEEDPAIMCNVCLQCQCCETPTEECPGEWAPEEGDFMNEPPEKSAQFIKEWRDRNRAEL